MGVNWTPKQKDVLEGKGDIIVSAAAGSGKTAVLTQKIANIVYDGTPISRMLVLTFTVAAAGEMKERIEDKLRELAQNENSPEKRMYLYSQADMCRTAHVSTIDAFCTYLFKRYFYKFGLSPATHIGDDIEKSSLIDDALSHVLDQYFDENPDSDLYTVFSGQRSFTENLKALYYKFRNMTDGRSWLHDAVDKYATGSADSERKYLFDLIKEIIQVAYEKNEILFDLADGGKHVEIAEDRRNHLKEVLDAKTTDELCDQLSYSLQKASANQPPEYKAMQESSVSLYKTAVECSKAFQNADDIIALQLPYMLIIEKLILMIDDELTALKKKRAVIDFTDIEHYAFELLSDDPDIRRSCCERFDHVFVDEYQDTSPLQDAIIHLLLTNSTSFFVGDVKQSIYRFRNAEPALFVNKLAEYEKRDDAHRYDLTSNFRSSHAVIDFTNTIFRNIMTQKTGGIDYDDKNALVAKDDAHQGHVYYYLMDKAAPVMKAPEGDDFSVSDRNIGSPGHTPENDPDLLAITEIEAQAKLTAGKISEMLGKKFYDEKEKCERYYRPSDFAILMYSVKDKGEFFVRELLLSGISAFSVSGGSYFDALEVQVFTNLLRVIDNRHLDIPLLSCMRSPIGAFTMDEITEIRINANQNAVGGRDLDMFDALKYAAESYDNTKAADFIARLDKWYAKSLITPINVFVRELLSESGYYRYVAALPNGKRRCTNLDRLLSFAENRSEHFGISDFLRYIDSAEKYLDDITPQEAFADAVTITTMHKSKGLEYNVVILPNLSTNLISRNSSTGALAPSADSIGAKMYIGGTECTSIYHYVNKYREKQALYADKMRLLYVALTRAKNQLMLISPVTDPLILLQNNKVIKKHIECHLLWECNTYTDWLLTALDQAGYTPIIENAVSDNSATSENLTFVCTNMYAQYKRRNTLSDIDFRKELAVLKNESDEHTDTDMSWRYPYEDTAFIPSKGSVTGFSHADIYMDYNVHSDEKVTSSVSAAQRGTATHLIFELIPLVAHTEKSVREFVEKLTADGLLTEEEAAAVRLKNVAAFFKRPMYERMRNSERLLREQSFTCFIPANELMDDAHTDEPVLVQGIIDCMFMENGKWILLDYKTDRVDANNPHSVQEKANSHKKQLRLYAYVIEKITHIPVSECYISFVNAYECKVDID